VLFGSAWRYEQSVGDLTVGQLLSQQRESGAVWTSIRGRRCGCGSGAARRSTDTITQELSSEPGSQSDRIDRIGDSHRCDA
jgi:hypothetical protein